MTELTEADFGRALHALLPRGVAWPRDPGTVQARAVEGLAAIVAGLHGRAAVLLEIESDPARTVELLADWERAYGLPDECVGEGQTLQQRRDALLARIASAGGQTRGYYIAVAAALGYSVTIEEFLPFKAGTARAGMPCSNSDWQFTWLIRGPEDTIREFRAGQSTAGERLRVWGNDALECVLSRLKPAHTTLLFGYGS